jgi:surface antigen
MKLCLSSPAIALLVALAAPVMAQDYPAATDFSGGASLPGYLQCVPYARKVSGIGIYGDAHTWWAQAEGRFARGKVPQIGAVMAFPAHGNMRLGHVAAVSQIIDSRTVLLRHANWSPIEGRRGQIEDNVRAIDVSLANDWSEVRVWYAPIGDLGTTRWPVQGFIYKQKPTDGSAIAAVRRKGNAAPALAQSLSGSDPIGDIIARRTRIALNR